MSASESHSPCEVHVEQYHRSNHQRDSPLVKIVPTNVGHRKAKGGIKFGDLARYNPKAFHAAVLLTAFKQKLHAQADAQEGLPCLQALQTAAREFAVATPAVAHKVRRGECCIE